MTLNYLYKFDVDILYDSKKIVDSVLKCSAVTCDLAKEKVSKRDSLLFDQIKHLKADSGLEEILVIFDFTNFIQRHKMEEFLSIKEIELTFNKLNGEIETDEEVTIRVIDFLKSNSMSKDCQVYYINSLIKSKSGKNLYEELKPRVFFDFDEQETILSKLYAYSGTLCSDCTLLDNIKLTEDEIVVVDDKQYIEIQDCYTMISKEFLFNELVKIKNYIPDDKKLPIDKKIPIDEILKRNACLEFEALYESMDNYDNNISDDLKEIICSYHNLPKTETRLFYSKLGELIKSYEEIGSKSNEVKWEGITVHNYPFDLNLFDGEGFISKEFCDEITNSLCDKLGNNKYKNSTSFQIRLPYIKGMVHSCDFKQFFKEKGITKIQHVIFNNGKEYDVDKVKIILTKSQFKLEGFIKNHKSKLIENIQDYIKLINEFNYSFGVIDANKEEKSTCSLEYQFISTLPLEARNIRDLIVDNKWRIQDACSKEHIIDQIEKENTLQAREELEMYKLNKDFYFSTNRYKRRKRQIYIRMKNKSLFSKFDVYGSRRYLSSDLLELLYYISFIKYECFEKENWLRKNQFYMPSKNSKNNKSIFLRSPHYSRNEIVLLTRRPVELYEEREKYFSHLTGVVMINPRSLAAERLGGADYDGDTVLVVNDKNIVFPVSKEMISYKDGKFNYKYNPCKIPSLKGKVMIYNHYEDRLKCFQNTFSSRVGQLSNEALIKAAEVYSNFNKNNNHNVMAEYTILNGLEIDSAKTGKKPEIHFSKNDNILLDYFLKAKKDFDKSGDMKKIKELTKSLDNANIFRYDSYWDEKYDDDEDDNEKNKNEYDYGLNVLSIAKNMDKNLKLFSYEECNEFKLDKNKIKPTYNPKAYAIAKIYSDTNKIIKTTLSKKVKIMKKSQMNRLYNQLNEISHDNNVDLDMLLDNISLDNINAFYKIQQYVNDGTFHYMKNDEEKIDYIKDLFDEQIDEAVIAKLINFNGEGFRLLFIILNYLLLDVKRLDVSFSNKESERFNNKLEYIRDGFFDEYNRYYNKYLNDINKIVNEMIFQEPEQIKTAIVNYLKKETYDISFNDVTSAITITESNMVFDVFFDIVKKYLGGKC